MKGISLDRALRHAADFLARAQVVEPSILSPGDYQLPAIRAKTRHEKAVHLEYFNRLGPIHPPGLEPLLACLDKELAVGTEACARIDFDGSQRRQRHEL